jgi:hypothetical protein
MELSTIDRKTTGILLGLGTATGLFLFALLYLVANSLTIVAVTIPSAVPIEVVVGLLGLALLSIGYFVAVLIGFGQEGDESDDENGGETGSEDISIGPDNTTADSRESPGNLNKRADINNDLETSARSSSTEQRGPSDSMSPDAAGGSDGFEESTDSAQRRATQEASGGGGAGASDHGETSDSPVRERDSNESDDLRELPSSYVRQTAEINADQRSRES